MDRSDRVFMVRLMVMVLRLIGDIVSSASSPRNSSIIAGRELVQHFNFEKEIPA